MFIILSNSCVDIDRRIEQERIVSESYRIEMESNRRKFAPKTVARTRGFLRFSWNFPFFLSCFRTRLDKEPTLVARERKLRRFSWTNARLIKRWWGGKRHEGGHEEETLCSRHALSLFVRSYLSLCAGGRSDTCQRLSSKQLSLTR